MVRAIRLNGGTSTRAVLAIRLSGGPPPRTVRAFCLAGGPPVRAVGATRLPGGPPTRTVHTKGPFGGTPEREAPASSPLVGPSARAVRLRLLVNYVIPRDARSGSATDAGVPEFMDFMLGENAGMRTWMKNGLGWMNAECRNRFKKGFVSCSDAQRREVLDAIAFPKQAAAVMRKLGL